MGKGGEPPAHGQGIWVLSHRVVLILRSVCFQSSAPARVTLRFVSIRRLSSHEAPEPTHHYSDDCRFPEAHQFPRPQGAHTTCTLPCVDLGFHACGLAQSWEWPSLSLNPPSDVGRTLGDLKARATGLSSCAASPEAGTRLDVRAAPRTRSGGRLTLYHRPRQPPTFPTSLHSQAA